MYPSNGGRLNRLCEVAQWNSQFRVCFKNRRTGQMEGVLRNEIVYDLLGDALPVDDDQIHAHVWHFCKRHADGPVEKCDALMLEQFDYRGWRAKTQFRSKVRGGENQARGFNFSIGGMWIWVTHSRIPRSIKKNNQCGICAGRSGAADCCDA